MYAVFAAFLLFILGVSVELYIGPLLKKTATDEPLWEFAQMLMAPICFTTILSASWFTAPLYAIAIFKFGFPEVTTALTAPFTVMKVGYSSFERAFLFVDGVAYVLHHSASMLAFACVAFDLVPAIHLTVAVPLAIQHLASVLKYHSKPAYKAVIGGAEVFFQFEAWFLLPILSPVPQAAVITLMTAHFIWLLVACIKLIMDLRSYCNCKYNTGDGNTAGPSSNTNSSLHAPRTVRSSLIWNDENAVALTPVVPKPRRNCTKENMRLNSIKPIS
jgi:hypothetical protein